MCIITIIYLFLYENHSYFQFFVDIDILHLYACFMIHFYMIRFYVFKFIRFYGCKIIHFYFFNIYFYVRMIFILMSLNDAVIVIANLYHLKGNNYRFCDDLNLILLFNLFISIFS